MSYRADTLAAVRESPIRSKLTRLGGGSAPRVLDLFAGCGGISLGFQRAGFNIVGALELDSEAATTHARAFHADSPLFEAHARSRDITEADPEELTIELGLAAPPELAVDVLVGGPPCQSFARVGRAKLREVREHPEAFIHDPRASLYLHYLAFVAVLQPLAILVENVPDVINHGGHNVPAEMCAELEHLGYSCRYTLLNAAHFGVPQMRDRMLLVALHRDLEVLPDFPTPTHHAVLPRGYHGTRAVALKHVRRSLFEDTEHFMEPVAPDASLPPAVTARDALCDLPPITKHLRGELRRGATRFDGRDAYEVAQPPNDFVAAMRNWPGFESPGYISDHVIRYLPRDYAIFRRMKAGDQYPEAHRIALKMFDEAVAAARASGHGMVQGSAEWNALLKATVPPYDPGKFPNKWRKMEANLPARTLMAHIGKDTYSHIHYDSEQARTISVREAARLQSFPDGFQFAGRMNAALRQIGNAVPPLLAYRLASQIRKSIEQSLLSRHESELPVAA